MLKGEESVARHLKRNPKMAEENKLLLKNLDKFEKKHKCHVEYDSDQDKITLIEP